MQNALIITLLVFILIGVLYIVVRGSTQHNFTSEQDLNHKIIVNNEKVFREINDLKMTLEHFHKTLKQGIEQLRAERQSFEGSVQAATKSKNGQNLLLNDRYKEVFDLQKQGLTVDQIAKQLEKGTGEVSFILQLATQERD
jgi:hypothetical protein